MLGKDLQAAVFAIHPDAPGAELGFGLLTCEKQKSINLCAAALLDGRTVVGNWPGAPFAWNRTGKKTYRPAAALSARQGYTRCYRTRKRAACAALRGAGR